VVSVKLALEYTEKDYSPANWLGFNDKDNKKKTEINDALGTYTNEMLSKFLLGTEPMSNWDKFVNELHAFGVDEIISLYDRVYGELNQ
jgi:putative aldouronate transport system substrate-binding protein